MVEGWTVRTTKLTEEYNFEVWREDRPDVGAAVRDCGEWRFALCRSG